MKLSTIAAAALSVSLGYYAANAQQLTNYEFVLFGARDSTTGATPNYTAAITVGSVPVKISKLFFLGGFLITETTPRPGRFLMIWTNNDVFFDSEPAGGGLD